MNFILAKRVLAIKEHCKKYGIPINNTHSTIVLLDMAFTHKSYIVNDEYHSSCPSQVKKNIWKNVRRRMAKTKRFVIRESIANNERLEFLGDAVLGFVTSEWLMQKFPKKSEGVLSRMKSYMVSKSSLYDVARKLHMEDILLIKNGVLSTSVMYKNHLAERKKSDINEKKILAPLANAVEAVIGAIYISLGMDYAKKFIYTHFNSITANVLDGSHHKDYKSLVQHYVQSTYGVKPSYSVVEARGLDHNKTYVVSLIIKNDDKKVISSTQGSGSTKKAAEQNAAARACKKINIQDDELLF